MTENNKVFEDEFLNDRVVFMEEGFNEPNCNVLKRQLLRLYKKDQKKPITMYISSYGGTIDDFLILYGLIKTLKCKIITIAIGKCMSAGAYLLLLGDERWAYPETRIMLHELGFGSCFNKLHEQQTHIKESEELQKILTGIVKRKTSIKNVETYLKDDQYMSPQEALKLGVINKIVK